MIEENLAYTMIASYCWSAARNGRKNILPMHSKGAKNIDHGSHIIYHSR